MCVTEMPVFRTRAAELDELRALCRRWLSTREFSLEALPGGFSGSPLYLVRTAEQAHVLKAFPPGTSPARARFVHSLIGHLRRLGVNEMPAVRAVPAGESFLPDRAGRLWELQDFVAGQPAATPTPGQVGAALAVLSRLHAAAAELLENPPDTGPSPGIARRVEQARVWLARPWHRLGGAAVGGPLARLVEARLSLACDLLRAADGERIVAAIAALEPRPLWRQTVLRDVWSAHVLFHAPASECVTGIIDVHAAATDTPATDLARLLGSWMTADAAAPAWWAERLAAYRAAPQAEPALGLVPFLAATGILFGLDNWFRWVLEAGRAFDRPDAVAARIDWLLATLPTALEILASRRDEPGLTGENCSL